MAWIAPGVGRSEDYPARRNGPEREMLRDWLDWHRATLLRKCAGLDATRLAMRAVPPSNLSLLGLVRHMSDTERGWVRQTFRSERVPDLYYRSDAPDADIEEAGPAGAEEDFERYRAECRAVDAALEGAKLDDTFTFREETTSVRWMWQHLVEEYARHNGHADLIREADRRLGRPVSQPGTMRYSDLRGPGVDLRAPACSRLSLVCQVYGR